MCGFVLCVWCGVWCVVIVWFYGILSDMRYGMVCGFVSCGDLCFVCDMVYGVVCSFMV